MEKVKEASLSKGILWLTKLTIVVSSISQFAAYMSKENWQKGESPTLITVLVLVLS